MKELKYFLVGFVGCTDFRKVSAHSCQEAKEAFAAHENIKVSGYLVAHKWTAENWNKSLKDDRPAISWTCIP